MIRFHFINHAHEISPGFRLDTDEAFFVPTFEMAEALIAHGADSAWIAVSPDRHAASGYSGGNGTGSLVPPSPYPCPHRTLIVIPTYNERDNVPTLIETIARYVAADILIVDDSSPDGTGRLVEDMRKKWPQLHALHRVRKEGLGAAYVSGFKWALTRGYDRIVEMDADMSHAPWDLPRLIAMSDKADVVLGSRYIGGGGVSGWHAGRRLLSRVANRYVAQILGRDIRDWTGGFRCYRADVLTHLVCSEVKARGYVFQVEMAWRAKCAQARICEIPIRFTDRTKGKSKLGWPSVFEAIHRVPRLRWWPGGSVSIPSSPGRR